MAKTTEQGLKGGTVFNALGKSIEEITAKLKEQIATYGMTTAQVDAYKLAQEGATEKQLEGIKALGERLELTGFAKSIKEQVKTPLEKAKEQLDKLKQAFEAKLIDSETYQRGITQALSSASEKSSGPSIEKAEGPKFAAGSRQGRRMPERPFSMRWEPRSISRCRMRPSRHLITPWRW